MKTFVQVQRLSAAQATAQPNLQSRGMTHLRPVGNFLTMLAAFAATTSTALADDLSAYYVQYFSQYAVYDTDPSLSTNYPALLTGRTVYGDIQTWYQGLFVRIETDARTPRVVKFYGPAGFSSLKKPCRQEHTAIPPSTAVGKTMFETNAWRYSTDIAICGENMTSSPPPIRWTLEDKITFNAPVRRKALDGGEFDASPMVIERAGTPWITYYWGYKLGLVESQSDWNDANRSKMPADWPVFPTAEDNFKLTTLPPPWVEGEVTEYVNTADFPRQPDGQYFYAATDADRTALDSIATWRRTGNSFKQGGYVSVCRFYGGANGGPNTHFYSASDTECNWLKGVSFLAYEGQTFRVNKPLPLPASAPAGTQPGCPAGSKPLYRLYNNASAPGKNYVSNHRYVTSRTTVDAAVAIGWLDEGVSMCVPE